MKKIDLENAIGLIIKIASKSIEKTLDVELRKRCGLSSGQWKVIGALALRNGLSQKDLAEMVFVEGPTLVPILDRMEKDGLVQRRVDKQDRRNNLVFLTKKSELLIDSIIDCVLYVRKVITRDIPVEQLEVTKNVLKKITKNSDVFRGETEAKSLLKIPRSKK
ncbi:MAG: MarR family transcriptional regulator [Thaumarchaeota archaeon]|nr:MarR family transcriptional regulator [Nitrososphaerota archaeon]